MPEETMRAEGAPAAPAYPVFTDPPWTLEKRATATWIHGSLGETIATVLFPDRTVGQANAALLVAAPELLAAAEAGGRYSDALLRLQEAGKAGRVVDAAPELERLFLDWHDKTHAALEKVRDAWAPR